MILPGKRIVLCGGVRTPIGHLSKTLSSVLPEDLMAHAIRNVLERTKIDPNEVNGALVGWVGQGSHAPNVARIAALHGGLPENAHAMTVQANCVSGIESVSSAARHIALQEGETYIAGGTESMSLFPYAIRGPRSLKTLRSLETVKNQWAELWNDPDVIITDTMEEGLTDPVKNLNMAATAEVCAQMFGIKRDAMDAYAHESFRRCLEGETNGFYESHVVPLKVNETAQLDKDEYVFLRKNLVAKPGMFAKAPTLFDNEQFSMKSFYEKFGSHMPNTPYKEGAKGTVTLFNSCARSDGAAALLVTTEDKAKKLGLEILGVVKSWAYYGINPAHMGIAPVYATQTALERANIGFKDLDQIELHEAFAATCLSIFKVGKDKYQQNWQEKWDEQKVNPNGGSIPLGHPLAATGTRIILNLLYAMKKNPQAKYGLATACAAGGLGGAIIIEKP